jgi:hypothetical protein
MIDIRGAPLKTFIPGWMVGHKIQRAIGVLMVVAWPSFFLYRGLRRFPIYVVQQSFGVSSLSMINFDDPNLWCAKTLDQFIIQKATHALSHLHEAAWPCRHKFFISMGYQVILRA